MTYPQSGFKVKGDMLVLSKIGSIRMRLHRPIGGDVKTLTVKRMPSGRWFAVFCCKVEAQPGEEPRGDVGVDLGLGCFAVLSDGTRIENPRYYRSSERRLAHLQRSLSRKEKGGRNRMRARLRVARLHEKIENRRSDFLHKVSARNIQQRKTQQPPRARRSLGRYGSSIRSWTTIRSYF